MSKEKKGLWRCRDNDGLFMQANDWELNYIGTQYMASSAWVFYRNYPVIAVISSDGDCRDQDKDIGDMTARVVECLNSHDDLIERIDDLEKTVAAKERFSISTCDIMMRYIHAMQAAVIASRTNGAEAGMAWIENTLCGPGHLPGDEETNAQEFFDAKIKELEDFRAKCNAE